MKYLHLGVPCGTSSRAREINLGRGCPRPLRSEAHPQGIPNLAKHEQERVEQANRIYSFACSLILLCENLGKDWSLEQPWRSLFWHTIYWRSVTQHCAPFTVQFVHCMFGGQRAKKTRIATSVELLTQLQCECDKQHEHLPRGRSATGYATAAEVEYPLRLCKSWAALIAKHLQTRYNFVAGQSQVSPDKQARAITFTQTKRSPEFIPDFKEVAVFLVKQPNITLQQKLDKPVILQSQTGAVTIPAGSRLVRLTPHDSNGGGADGVEAPEANFALEAEAEFVEAAFTIPWSCEEFLQEAARVGHPANIFNGLSDSLTQAIVNNARLPPEVIVKKRAGWLKCWTARALELLPQERAFMRSLPPYRQKIRF